MGERWRKKGGKRDGEWRKGEGEGRKGGREKGGGRREKRGRGERDPWYPLNDFGKISTVKVPHGAGLITGFCIGKSQFSYSPALTERWLQMTGT